MIKTVLKIFLAVIIYTVLFITANALLPFSKEFKELGSSGDPLSFLYLLISSAWACFTIYYIIKNTFYSGKKLLINILCIMFFVQYFMTQIETLFFGNAFTVLTKLDITLIMFAGLIPLLGTIPLLIKYFQNQNIECERSTCSAATWKLRPFGLVGGSSKLCIKDISIKLGIIGIIYLCIYMLFGYFVAWQFEELRIFYTGSAEKLSFWGQMNNITKTNPITFPFQILRGALFGAAVVPIRNMINKNKKVFITSVCLIYLCTAIVLIIPNVLFPDIVRIAHLIEMTGSMLLFGIIAGNILWAGILQRSSPRIL